MPFFHDQTRADLRQVYVEAWRKFRECRPLEPLEVQIAAVIAEHPEYHALLESREAVLKAEFPPEGGMENPFLHLGLHLAIREQINTDRPAGIAAIHRQLSARQGSPLEAEHCMLEVLAETIWEAQRAGLPPDEEAYLARLRRL